MPRSKSVVWHCFTQTSDPLMLMVYTKTLIPLPLYNFQPWIHNTFFQDFKFMSGCFRAPTNDIGSGKVAVTVTILS